MSAPERVRFGGMATPRGFRFELTGGDVALDLANTLVGRRTEHPDELLSSYPRLVEWSRQSGILDPKSARDLIRDAAAHPLVARRTLRRAIEIRELIFKGLPSPVLDKRTLEKFSRLSIEAGRHRHLTWRGNRAVWSWDAEGLDRMLWPVIHAAVTLLTSEARNRVRMCQGGSCRWLFLDNSRQGNRRWCDMTVCGNRAKARRHYNRKKGIGD
jgi:predicted RNA-binding Zn ribbon-like protein